MKDNVYIIGGRAVGKTSVGAALAHHLDLKFLDTDILITEACGRSVAEIVKQEGWAAFRKYEEKVLQDLLGCQGCVVATGGGAILHRTIWPELQKQGLVVWLQADLSTLCGRIAADSNSESLRPSLTGKDVYQELSEVLRERNPLYKDTADCIIDSGKLLLSDTVHTIEELYRKSFGDCSR